MQPAVTMALLQLLNYSDRLLVSRAGKRKRQRAKGSVAEPATSL
jgi:hypothetical protein